MLFRRLKKSNLTIFASFAGIIAVIAILNFKHLKLEFPNTSMAKTASQLYMLTMPLEDYAYYANEWVTEGKIVLTGHEFNTYKNTKLVPDSWVFTFTMNKEFGLTALSVNAEDFNEYIDCKTFHNFSKRAEHYPNSFKLESCSENGYTLRQG